MTIYRITLEYEDDAGSVRRTLEVWAGSLNEATGLARTELGDHSARRVAAARLNERGSWVAVERHRKEEEAVVNEVICHACALAQWGQKP